MHKLRTIRPCYCQLIELVFHILRSHSLWLSIGLVVVVGYQKAMQTCLVFDMCLFSCINRSNYCYQLKCPSQLNYLSSSVRALVESDCYSSRIITIVYFQILLIFLALNSHRLSFISGNAIKLPPTFIYKTNHTPGSLCVCPGLAG